MTTKQTYMAIAEDLCGTAFKVAELLEQRDKLLASLDAIARGLTNGQKKRGETFQSIARAAIAKAEGGRPDAASDRQTLYAVAADMDLANARMVDYEGAQAAPATRQACDVCGASFWNADVLKLHVAEAHGD